MENVLHDFSESLELIGFYALDIDHRLVQEHLSLVVPATLELSRKKSINDLVSLELL